MNRITTSLVGLAAAASLIFSAVPVSAASAVIGLGQLQSGMLIRSVSRSAVYYYGADGFRYVFVNDKTYGTWYGNFDNIKWLTDADMGIIQIGGNATYRPGTRMIKINSDPKTYAVGANGTLHWVTSEAVAVGLYGANWNKMIDDVADGFFSNYTKGSDITEASQFNIAAVTAASPDINADKNLRAPSTISIGSSAYSPNAVTIPVGRSVKWTNSDSTNHAVTSDDLSWGSGTMSPGGIFTRTFKTPGTFTYFDSYHPQLTGTVIVQ